MAERDQQIKDRMKKLEEENQMLRAVAEAVKGTNEAFEAWDTCLAPQEMIDEYWSRLVATLAELKQALTALDGGEKEAERGE
jgi:hypothetical protein